MWLEGCGITVAITYVMSSVIPIETSLLHSCREKSIQDILLCMYVGIDVWTRMHDVLPQDVIPLEA